MKCNWCKNIMFRRHGGYPFDSEFRCSFCGSIKDEDGKETGGPSAFTLEMSRIRMEELYKELSNEQKQ